MNESQKEIAAQAGFDVATGELHEELAWVEQELIAALADLRAPFSQLVQSQLRRSYPLVRAAIVLTAGVGNPDSQGLRAQRVHLAAALEMLQLAFSIHTRLLASTDVRQEIDQSVMGSTILAGDFCFSRAAGLAVKTESPVVVDVFAQTLQRMSESRLRKLFSADDQTFDENNELFRSGILGAMALTSGSQELQEVEMRLADRLAVASRERSLATVPIQISELLQLSADQAARWYALVGWLAQ